MGVLQTLGGLIRTPRRTAASLGSGLEAGRFNRRMSGWLPTQAHVNTLVSASGKTVLARTRFLARNNPYAAGAVDCFSGNLIGAGITPSWDLPDNLVEKKKEIQKTWARWTDSADAENITDLYGLMRRVGRELFIAGEIFVRKRPRFLTDGLPVPLQLQLLPSEMCPIEMTLQAQSGNQIRQGIEFDGIGRRVAYHFWKSNPGDSTEQPRDGDTTRIPAEQILHIFDPVEAGQIRGLSRLTPAVVLLFMLDIYDDAELARKQTAALFSVFITRPDPSQTFINKVAEDKAKAATGADAGVATVDLKPGSAHQLFPGEGVTVAGPGDVGPGYEAFQYRSLSKFSAAVGLPYAGLTGDTTKSSYGSQRAAMLESRRRLEALQFGVIIFQLCRPIAHAFMDAAILAGKLKLEGYASDPTPWRDITWKPPKWDWIDPLKDLQAERLAVRAGFKARSDVVEADGRDPIDNDAKIKADRDRAAKDDLVFDSNAAQVSDAGVTQARPPLDELPPSDADDKQNQEIEPTDDTVTGRPSNQPLQ